MKMKNLLLPLTFLNIAFMSNVAFIGAACAATLTVTNTADSGAGSLRDTVAAAAADDTIVFSAGLSGQTITLSNGQLTLTNDLTINASGLPKGIIISGNTNSRIFEVSSNATVTLDSLTLRDGAAPNGNYPTNSGGAVLNYGHLTLNACTLQSDRATQDSYFNGGGIENYKGALIVSNCAFSDDSAYFGGAVESDDGGSLTVYNSAFSSNSASFYGGALENVAGQLAVSNCAFSDNFASYYGGGIENQDTLTVNQSTFSGNSAEFGGGIENEGALTVNQTAFSGNSAGFGGGIEENKGALTINQSRFSDNSARFGGGMDIEDTSVGDKLAVNQSTFSDNSAGFGGGIEDEGGVLLTINQSTFSGNSATNFGGGIDIEANSTTLTVNQGTFSSNSAGDGGGGIENESGDTTLNLFNSIVAANSASSGGDIDNGSAALNFSGTNLVQNLINNGPSSGPAPLDSAPDLAPLGNYGGPTLTTPPLTGSPAIDDGADSATNLFTTDQRGYPRKFGAHVDIGAVELQGVIGGSAPRLLIPAALAGGSLTFDFTNVANAEFTVLATTNLALPLSQWSSLGLAPQGSPGQYEFTDPNATNYPQRFYQVVSP